MVFFMKLYKKHPERKSRYMLNNQIFEFLQHTFADSRGIIFNYFDGPEADLSALDIGIRTHLKNSEQLYDLIRPILRSLKFGEITIVKDPLLMTSITFRSDPDNNSFYSIGPFRSLPYEENDYAKIQINNNFTLTASEDFKYLLKDVPCNIMRIEALAIAKNILYFLHQITDPTVHDYNLEQINSGNFPIIPLEDINARAKIAEEMYSHEEKLLKYITEGNEEKAFSEAKFFRDSDMDHRITNRLLSHRSLLFSTNTLFRKAAQITGIHPIYLDEISQSFAQKLALCTTHQQLNNTYDEMLVDYCALCRTHATRQYSPNMCKIINYISLNLSEDISLYSIAEAVNFSPSYISRKFKEEVGKSLSTYITEQRMILAKSLLEKTGLSIKEISLYIGIPDWNYFTKLFKKAFGITPTEYKKTL